MKRILCTAFAVGMLTAGASAYQLPQADAAGHIIQLVNVNRDPEAQDQMLQKLGVFAAGDGGAAYDRALTRAEGAELLFRLLGSEEGGAHPFTDVPAWADRAVGWLYQNKLVFGVSDTRYGAAEPLSASGFARLLSRALDGDDRFLYQILLPSEEEVFLNGAEFRRQDAAAMITRAFEMRRPSDDATLAQILVQRGVFTAQQLGAAAWDVLMPVYEYDMNAYLAGVCFASRTGEGFQMDSYSAAESCSLPYFYAWRTEGGKTVYYQIDCRTLQETPVGALEGADARTVEYQVTIDGTDYLWECANQNGQPRKSRLLAVREGRLEVALCTEDVAGAAAPQRLVKEEGLSITASRGVYVVTKQGVRLQDRAAEPSVLWEGEDLQITLGCTYTASTVELLRRSTGAVLQEYSVPQDGSGMLRGLRVSQKDSHFLFGEAGLYERRGEQLIQHYAGAAADFAVGPAGSSFYIVTHDPGERIHGMGGEGGDKLIRISCGAAAGDPCTVLDDTLGLKIMRIADDPHKGSKITLYQIEESWGSYYGYTYEYDFNDDSLTVTDFSNPHLQKSGDGTDRYKWDYIRAEQERLDALRRKKPSIP